MSGLEASLLLGSVHSVLLAIVLGRRARNRRANQYLAAVLAAISLLLFDGFLRARGTTFAYPHLIGLTAWVPFVLAPLVFLYVREMTSPDPSRLRPPWRHFLITAAYVLMLAVMFYPRSAAYKMNVAVREVSWLVLAIEVGLLVYGIAYAIASLVLLRRHRGHVQAIYSNLHGVSLRWLLVLSMLNTLVWIGAFVGFVIRMSGGAEAGAASAIVPIGSTILVFVIGYFQLGQGEIFVGQPIDVALSSDAAPSSPPAPAGAVAAAPAATSTAAATPAPAPTRGASTPAVPDLPAAPAHTPDEARPAAPDKVPDRVFAAPGEVPAAPDEVPAASAEPIPYARARLAEDDAAALEARIKGAMTDKHLYQRAGLTLAELADEVAATPHEISQVLSTRLQRNFYNFVNEHRIEHVKTGLRTSDRPVLDLAFEAGFQSKSTFNSAFRKATGTTPRAYRQRSTG